LEKSLKKWLKKIFTSNADVTEALLGRFAEYPAEVDSFLDRYVREGWISETGLPIRSDFERRNYENVAELISPEYVAMYLRGRYNVDVANPVFHCPDDTLVEKRITNHFLYLHNLSTQSQTNENSSNE